MHTTLRIETSINDLQDHLPTISNHPINGLVRFFRPRLVSDFTSPQWVARSRPLNDREAEIAWWHEDQWWTTSYGLPRFQDGEEVYSWASSLTAENSGGIAITRI